MNDTSNTPQLPTPPRTWLTLFMGGMLIVSGMVMGAGASVLFLKHQIDEPNLHPDRFGERILKSMTHDLDLTEEQSVQIRAIFKSHQEEMHTIRLQIKDEVSASFEELKGEVEAVLSPEQIEKWEHRIQKISVVR